MGSPPQRGGEPRRGCVPSWGLASPRSSARGAISSCATAPPTSIWSTFGRTSVPPYGPLKGCPPRRRSASVVPCWSTSSVAINRAMRRWWSPVSISKSSPPDAKRQLMTGVCALPVASECAASSQRSCPYTPPQPYNVPVGTCLLLSIIELIGVLAALEGEHRRG
jgi:hypothetical protein